jgi:transcriptional regulator with XRE-family HTH domain
LRDIPIGERIRLFRLGRGLTQEQLAGLADVSPSWVSKAERGLPIDRRMGPLSKVAKVLGVTVAELVGQRLPLRTGADGRDGRLRALRGALLLGNVHLHGIAVALALGDFRGAIRRAEQLDPTRLPATCRQAAYWIDLARANASTRKSGEAVHALLNAERIAAEQVRHRIVVREMVREFVQHKRRSITPQLRGLADRIGVSINQPVSLCQAPWQSRLPSVRNTTAADPLRCSRPSHSRCEEGTRTASWSAPRHRLQGGVDGRARP